MLKLIDFSLDNDSVLHAKWQRALPPLVSLHVKQKRARGRPRKHPREDDDLKVKVEEKELALRTTRKDLQADKAIFSLSVPNQLLFQWHRIAQKPRDYIPLPNDSIVDKALAIRPDCCQVADNLAFCAIRLRSQVATATSGRREVLLGKVCEGHKY